jgi:hypothetical protein
MRANLKAITATGIMMLAAAASVGLLSTPSRAQLPKSDPAQSIPAYHAAPPKETLGPTLDPSQFKDSVVQNSYAMAAKVKNVLYQQPCYCFCDKNNGHHSLFDCFASTHASECNTCMAEGIFAYEQTQKGKSPAKIRAAIIHGDWRRVDLTAYKDPVKLP